MAHQGSLGAASSPRQGHAEDALGPVRQICSLITRKEIRGVAEGDAVGWPQSGHQGLFAAYVTADGVAAVVAGARAAGRGERWWTLIVEGGANLAAAAAALIWAALAVVPLVSLASGRAVLSGGLMLAAAHRLSASHGRWLLAFGGGVSAGWGALMVAWGRRPTTCAAPRCG